MYLLRPLLEVFFSEPHDFSISEELSPRLVSMDSQHRQVQCEGSWLLTLAKSNFLGMSAICGCHIDGCWALSLQHCTQAALQLVVKNPVDPVVAGAVLVAAGACHQ